MKRSIRTLTALLMACAIVIPVSVKGTASTIRAAEDEVAIDETNFPDKQFRNMVKSLFDKDKNQKLSQAEIEVAWDLSIPDMGITTLKGIEHLRHLVTLDCQQNNLKELDLSKNDYLSYLDCSINELTKLDVSNCPLSVLICDQNYLKELDVSHMDHLYTFTCAVNDLSELDVSHNPELDFLMCGVTDWMHMGDGIGMSEEEPREINNHITKLDLKNNKSLTTLACDGIGIKQLDLSNSKKLYVVQCNNCALTSLDVTNCPKLYALNCPENALTKLSVKGCSALEYLVCGENKLKTLDLSDCESLTDLNCYMNELTEIKLGSVKTITSLNAYENKLTKIDLSKLTDVEYLSLDDNKLSEIDLSKQGSLQSFSCSKNPISKLDLSKCINLTTLACEECNLTSLDVTKNTKLNTIFAWQNKLTKIDVSKCPKMEYLIISENELSSLDISKNPKLKTVSASNNKITKIDVSKNLELSYLGIDSNQLSSIDLSKNAALETVDLSRNNFKSVTLPTEKATLTALMISDNEIEELDVHEYTSLVRLEVYRNKLKKLDVSKNTDISILMVSENDITELDITKCEDLIARIKEFGIQEDTDYNIFYSRDEEECLFFSIDTDVDLKGYKLPKPTNPNPTPTPPAEDPTFEDFVERLYTVALGRASEPEGKAFWVKQVVEEGKTGADCARFFLLDADEFMKRNLSVDDFVETLYATFFDRESDAAGKKGWVDAISSGAKTRAEVVNDFIESTEWCDVCATYGVKSGAQYHKATKASKNAINFATRLYTCCLKRDAEEGGLQYWSLALTNLEKTGAEAAQFFFESDEFIGFKTTDKEYLLRLYTTFMDREPVQSEVDYWLGEIAGGRQTRHSILAFFAQSEEFTGICKQYGIDRGTIE